MSAALIAAVSSSETRSLSGGGACGAQASNRSISLPSLPTASASSEPEILLGNPKCIQPLREGEEAYAMAFAVRGGTYRHPRQDPIEPRHIRPRHRRSEELRLRFSLLFRSGAPDRIRTCGLCLRRAAA